MILEFWFWFFSESIVKCKEQIQFCLMCSYPGISVPHSKMSLFPQCLRPWLFISIKFSCWISSISIFSNSVPFTFQLMHVLVLSCTNCIIQIICFNIWHSETFPSCACIVVVVFLWLFFSETKSHVAQTILEIIM